MRLCVCMCEFQREWKNRPSGITFNIIVIFIYISALTLDYWTYLWLFESSLSNLCCGNRTSFVYSFVYFYFYLIIFEYKNSEKRSFFHLIRSVFIPFWNKYSYRRHFLFPIIFYTFSSKKFKNKKENHRI